MENALLSKEITPRTIVDYLDQYVIGQDEAKRALAVAVYSHYRKLSALGGRAETIAKSNVLIIGSSGTGKTLACETLSRLLSVPFVTGDATSLAQTRYVNEEIEAILLRLLDKAGGDAQQASRGIVFIDEIDKLKVPAGESRATSGESVQHALLKIMEGAPVKLGGDRYLDTTNILFICGGAFVGLDKIMSRTHNFGFIATSKSDDKSILDRLNDRVKPADLFEFGLIPEFTGRLPVIVRFGDLTKDMLVRIMSVPKNAIYHQFREILRAEGVELVVAPPVFEQIAEIAIEYKTGGRSLRGIFEELMMPILYVVPDHRRICRVEISSLFEAPRYFQRNTGEAAG
ncbi:MAG: AAA family ATPase [Candidatus Accumulibacter sp.]|jgi:ATP-dependent Clp protease ATP-binding subunit ClpX|nr:AAA family ATPase [Accumulibacter sp.]